MKERYEIPASEEIKVQVEANIMSGEAGGDVPEIPGCPDYKED